MVYELMIILLLAFAWTVSIEVFKMSRNISGLNSRVLYKLRNSVSMRQNMFDAFEDAASLVMLSF